jgi:hypothetical protein
VPTIDDIWNGLTGGSYGPHTPDADTLLTLIHNAVTALYAYTTTNIVDATTWPTVNMTDILAEIHNPILNMNDTFYANVVDLTSWPTVNMTDILAEIHNPVLNISTTLYANIVDIPTYPHANLTDLIENLTTALADLRAQVGYPSVDGTSIYVMEIAISNELDIINESVEVAETQATLAATTAATILAANSITSLIIGIAKAAGGSLEVSIAELIAQFFANPPLQLLHAGTVTTITSGAVLTFPTGAYGINMTFTVPVSWGRTAGIIPIYLPSVAYIAWQNGLGYTGNPEPINTSPVSIFPLPANASSIQIDLPVGITGLYYWLLL